MKYPEIRGCGTALVTPMTADGSLDEAALERLVRFQLDEGVDFLVPCGTTGETPTLSRDEQTRVVEIVRGTAAGAVPIVAGAGGNHTAAVIEAARHMESLGVDALLSVTPYYNKPSQEGLYQHFAAIAAAVEIPIVLYNVPGRTGVNLEAETTLRLAEITNIAAIKEASGNLGQITVIADGRPEDFRLLSGDDNLVLPLIAVGGHGVISVVSNIAPGWMAELCRHSLAGDFAAARELQPKLDRLATACFLDTNPIPVKAGLALQGRIGEHYRLPLVPMGEANRLRLAEMLRELGLLGA